MHMRQGIVVDTHPDGPAVDLFMVDTGERLVGVKLLTMGASSRTGGVDLPEITGRANKWDVSEDSDNLVWAAVGYIGRQPVVTGFILPPTNQIAIRDKRTFYRRHQSDVQWSIDGDGNAQLLHPSGAYIRVGETPDAAPVESALGATVDRNIGRKPYVRIGLAGNAVVVTMTPEGDMQVALEGNASIFAKGDVSVKAGGNISAEAAGGASVKAAGSASIECQTASIKAPGGVEVDTPLLNVPNGDVVASGISLTKHMTSGVVPGPGNSGPPIPGS